MLHNWVYTSMHSFYEDGKAHIIIAQYAIRMTI